MRRGDQQPVGEEREAPEDIELAPIVTSPPPVPHPMLERAPLGPPFELTFEL